MYGYEEGCFPRKALGVCCRKLRITLSGTVPRLSEVLHLFN